MQQRENVREFASSAHSEESFLGIRCGIDFMLEGVIENRVTTFSRETADLEKLNVDLKVTPTEIFSVLMEI